MDTNNSRKIHDDDVKEYFFLNGHLVCARYKDNSTKILADLGLDGLKSGLFFALIDDANLFLHTIEESE